MVKLISKGGFRERANRSKAYQFSENRQAVLNPAQYLPAKTPCADSSETATPPRALTKKSDAPSENT
ncbi:hypothetical protein [Acinetobacter sp. WZC-1]|uniref:hypothetical protein n=1 Tax=Acinetobacter sp. WZC-1 TaxID=3459034 RepID=UPI00403DFB22